MAVEASHNVLAARAPFEERKAKGEALWARLFKVHQAALGLLSRGTCDWVKGKVYLSDETQTIMISECEKKILVINDMPEQLLYMQSLLGDSGYQVLTAKDGHEGIELAEREYPDLVISDVQMPRVNGIELCKRLRAETEFQTTPILLVSSELKDTPSAVAGLKAGADDYVEAPFDPLRLITKATQLIERKQAEEALRKAYDELAIKVDERTIELSEANEILKRQIAERERAEEELRHQLDLTNTITANMGEGLYALDENGRVTFMNPAAERMLGWTEWELLGREMHEVIHFQRADGTRVKMADCPLIGVLRSGVTVHTEDDVFTRRDGSTFHVSYTSSPIITGGRITGAVLSFQDITERKRAEAALSESEDRYRDLVENSRELFCTHGLDGQILSVNRWTCETLGYSREELLRKKIKDIVKPEFRSQFAPYIEEIKSRGTAIGTMIVETASGEPRIWEYYNTLRTTGVALPVVRGMAQDVTERRLAEAALCKSEEKFRRIIETANEGVWILDAEARITYINQRLANMLGYAVEELVGQQVFDFMDEAHIPAAKQRLERRRQGIKEQHDFPFRRKDGSELWTIISGAPIFNEHGECTGSLAMFTDITERKRVEGALRASEARYRLLFENNPQPMWVYDRETLGFLAVNEAAIQHYGYSREEFLAMTIKDIRPPEDVAPLLDSVSQMVPGLNEGGTWRHRKKDGTIIYVEVNSHTLPFVGRQAELVLPNDITERKRAEDELREITKSKAESLALLDTILSLAPIGFAFHNREFVFERINEKLAAINGLPVEHHLGRTWRDVLPEMAEMIEPILQRVLETGGPVVNIELSGETPS
nr:PAS domain S-box protein [Acidobacteriota bacterium]